jgi:hypothetical protein
MQSDDYRHLREAFAKMARQRPDSPETARWLAVAQACMELERQPTDVGRTRHRRTAHAHIRSERRDI